MRRKVIITNKTDFDTRTLRSIILAVLRRELKPTEYPIVTVSVGYPKSKHVTGKSYLSLNSKNVSFGIFIPKNQVDVVEVCHRVKVCLDYCLGRHGRTKMRFTDWRQLPGKAVNYPFAKKFTLIKAQPKVGQKLTGAASSLKKAELAQDKVNFWERKLKHATTMLKKWRKQLRYHETRGERLISAEAEKMEKQQGMTAEEFLKLPPVGESKT